MKIEDFDNSQGEKKIEDFDNYLKYLTFDIGSVNIGVSIAYVHKNTKDLSIIGKKIVWKNWKTEINNTILTLIDDYKLSKNDTMIFIERQISINNIKIMSYIEGFFNALNFKIKLLSPVSRGQKLAKRIDRKKYSLNLLKDIIPSFYIKDIPNKINYKYHDVADCMMLSLIEINYEKYNPKKIIVQEIK